MHARLSVNSLCFLGASLAEQTQRWRKLDAKRVSFMSPLLLDGEIEAVRTALKTGDYRLETISHGPLINGPLSHDAASWRDGQHAVMKLIDAAAELGGRSVYTLSGGHGALDWEDAAACYAAAAAPCLRHAEAKGVALAVENASTLYADCHIAHSLRDTVVLAEIANVGICIDIFGCWTEADLRKSIERGIQRCRLVQVSDYVLGDRSLPNRAVPGDGAIPLERILDWILSAGYQGTFDFELLGPRIDKEGHFNAVRRAADYVGEILHRLGA